MLAYLDCATYIPFLVFQTDFFIFLRITKFQEKSFFFFSSSIFYASDWLKKHQLRRKKKNKFSLDDSSSNICAYNRKSNSVFAPNDSLSIRELLLFTLFSILRVLPGKNDGIAFISMYFF